jgi:myo-inositol-1(or 4)-monophosphatase
MQAIETNVAAVLPKIEALARQAGDMAMSYFQHGKRTTAGVTFKGGGSPVTEADFAVDRFLFENLLKLNPSAGWLSEETADSLERLEKSSLFIVDPIDGTIAFTRGDDRWAVSVALVEQGRPVAGVVHAPALGQTFVAGAGLGARLNDRPIRTSLRQTLEGADLIAPRGLAHFFEASPYGFNLAPRTPSLALRLADIASGIHDVAIAAAQSRDWDIAAADVILSEAGGVLSELEGSALIYNRPQLDRDMLVAAPAALFDDCLALARAASLKGTR